MKTSVSCQRTSTLENKLSLICKLLLFVYVLVNAYFISQHINWRDEAQAWMLARDLSVPELFKQMSYEGHSCMWHLLLMPLAKLGLPYVSMNILSLLLMTFAAAIFLKKAPFPLIFKVLILFSSAFMYYYPVISRCYCLAPSIICLLAIYYPSRHSHPFIYGGLIAFLIQTHLFVFGMAAALSLFWFGEAISSYCRCKDRKQLGKQAIGLSFPLISLIVLLLQFTNVTDSSFLYLRSFSEKGLILSIFNTYCRIFVAVPFKIVLPVCLLLFAVSMAFLFVHTLHAGNFEQLKPYLIVILSVIAHFFIAIFINNDRHQKMIVIHYFILWLFWVNWNPKMQKSALIASTLAICSIFLSGLSFYYTIFYEITGKIPYSDSKTCAEFISQNIPDDDPILVCNQPLASSILPYLSSRNTFYNIEYGCPYSFVTWKHTEPVISDYSDFCKWASENFPDKNSVTVIFQHLNGHIYFTPIKNVENYISQEDMLYQTSTPTVLDEDYTVYRVPVHR